MRAPATALILVASALAGCAGPPDGADAPDHTMGEADAPAQESPGAPAETSAAPGNPTPERRTANGTSRLTAVGVCPDATTCAGVFNRDFATFDLAGGVLDAVLVATWEPSSPSADRLNVAVVLRGEAVAGAVGPSPLTIPLEPPIAPGEYRVGLLPAPPGGALVQQILEWTLAYNVSAMSTASAG